MLSCSAAQVLLTAFYELIVGGFFELRRRLISPTEFYYEGGGRVSKGDFSCAEN